MLSLRKNQPSIVWPWKTLDTSLVPHLLLQKRGASPLVKTPDMLLDLADASRQDSVINSKTFKELSRPGTGQLRELIHPSWVSKPPTAQYLSLRSVFCLSPLS